jgi:hypothetical protein
MLHLSKLIKLNLFHNYKANLHHEKIPIPAYPAAFFDGLR